MKGTLKVVEAILLGISADEFWGIDITVNDVCFCGDYSVALKSDVKKLLKIDFKYNVKNKWYAGDVMKGKCKVRVILWKDD